ncbi:LysR family transcriptional regulator [Lacrimispora indolis]|uniref:LysR family transcriptional regulator n=1 Tax=Lacrimispora indolis TaxID=69825 RepID=UPI00041A1457|nr:MULTISPECIES: LysR family transcriptional regulator [Lachnospiraceae]MBE7721369.1 LysR family transcriptional regulator [Lacrimispora celerecrescens]
MNFNNLYYFAVLASFQHYTKAAEYLCITQPSLSHAIASLEKEYGVKLFERDGRNVKLSKYGELLNSYISKGFKEIEHGNRLLDQFAYKDAGYVDLSFLFVLGYQFVPELIKSFNRNAGYKNITINLKQYNTQDSISGLKNGGIDISLCAFISNEPTITFFPVLKQELICIVSDNHPLAGYDSVEMEQLIQYPLIKYTDAVGEIQDVIDKLFEDCSSYPQTQNFLNEEITIAGFISTGIDHCIAIVPNLELLDGFKIKKIKLNHPDAYRNIYLAVANNRPMANCVKLFYEFIIQKCT